MPPHTPTTHHPVPPVLLAIGIVGAIVLHMFLPIYTVLAYPVTLVGIAPIALGIALAIWAITQFKKKATPAHPGSTPKLLVTSGPFQYSRNPMYMSLTLVLVGVVLLTGSAGAAMVVPMFVVAIQVLHINREQRIMREIFGEEYEAYCRRVRGWV